MWSALIPSPSPLGEGSRIGSFCVVCPHPQPFSPREKGAGLKVPLPQGEGFRVRAFPRLQTEIVFRKIRPPIASDLISSVLLAFYEWS